MTKDPGPFLDRTSEPWFGVFPTLGTVRIEADGSYEVDVEPPPSGDADDAERREAALTFGWALPLSLARRGYRFAWGNCLVDPGGVGGLIVHGYPQDEEIVLLELLANGWTVLADHFVPVRWSSSSSRHTPASHPCSFPTARQVLVGWIMSPHARRPTRCASRRHDRQRP